MQGNTAAKVVCAGVSALVYLNSLDCGFCFDDLSAIRDNKDLRSKTPWSNLLWDDFWGTPMDADGSHKSYRPLVVATFRLNYLAHELRPTGYHLVNVLLHAIVCYLYVRLCLSAFARTWPALVAGLLFAVHPIHTEAVAGVVGRAEMLSALFFLLFMFQYREAALKGRVVNLFIAVILGLFSVFSKEQGITVIAVCLVIDLFVLQKLDAGSIIKALRAWTKERECPGWFRPFVLRALLLGAFGVTVMFLRLRIMKVELPVFTIHDNPAVGLSTPYRQLHWLYLCFVNCWLLLNPSPLCADWTMNTIPLITSLADLRNLATITTFAVLAMLGVYAINGSEPSRKVAVMGLSLMIFPFIPASNLFFPVGFVVAERILYVPSMGFCMLVSLGLSSVAASKGGPWSSLVKPALVFLLIIHGLKTMTRNRDWFSDSTLFTSAIQVNPLNAKIHNNLGHEYENAGDLKRAEELFRRASELQSDDIGAFMNLGRVLKAQERYKEAEEAYKIAVGLMPKGNSFRIAPGHISLYYNLANLLRLDPNRLNEAYDLYQKTIAMKPDYVEAHMNKGDVLLRMNRTLEAKAAFERAVQHNPEYTDALYNLGNTLMQLSERAEAERAYRRALSINKDHKLSLLNLGTALLESKDLTRAAEAEQLLRHYVSLEPNSSLGYFQLALLHLDQNHLDQAEVLLARCVELEPTHRSALYNLGLLLYHEKRYDETVRYLSRLLEFHPSHMNGAQTLADAYVHLSDLANAERWYGHILQADPNNVPALHNLGVVKATLGLFAEAVKLFSRTLELDPSHKSARKYLDQAARQLGN